MLINNHNNWFANQPSSHYTSQPNFILSDYQQIEQNSRTSENSTNVTTNTNRNLKDCKNNFNRIKTGTTNHQKKHAPQSIVSVNPSPSPKYNASVHNNHNQPQLVKKQIRSAFQAKSKSTLNLNSNNNNNNHSSNEQINTEICDLTSKTCTHFDQNRNDLESPLTAENPRLQNSKTKSSSHLDIW